MNIVNGKRRFGCWAGNPNGVAERLDRCIEEVGFSERGSMYRQCGRKRGFGPDGLYCKQHDPDAIARKREAERALEKARRDEDERIFEEAYRLVKALGCGEEHYNWRTGKVTEHLVISFKEVELLLCRLKC